MKIALLCFGQLRYADGANRWRKFIQRNPELRTAALQIEQEEIGTERTEFFSPYPLIVGEIQFGNWALAYRDFFKVLKANVSNTIDCLIYIVPTGSIELMLRLNGIIGRFLKRRRSFKSLKNKKGRERAGPMADWS